MRYVYATLVTAILIAGCSSTESDATATTSPPETIATTSTSTTIAATTTIAPTTTWETLDEAAGVWCTLNPLAFLATAVILDLISESDNFEIETTAILEFWFSDGVNRLTGEQKFSTLPKDWYEYPGAVGALQNEVSKLRQKMTEEDFAHACNIAFETR